jgi:hypothetical protein
MQQVTCKFMMAKCNWNVVKSNNSQNVWGWQRTRFLLVNSGITQHILMLNNVKILHIHWHYTLKQSYSNYSHAWNRTFGWSKLITTIVFHHIQFNHSRSQLNNIKYGEKDATKTCELNLYPTSKHDTYRFQYLVWPFWSSFFHKSHFTICTISSTNMFTLRWSCEVVWWLISFYSHNSWNSQQNLVPWWTLWMENKTYLFQTPCQKMHKQLFHSYDSIMAPILMTLINVQS